LYRDNAPSHTSIFTKEFFTKNNMTLVTTHPTFPFPRLKIREKGLRLDTIEVIQAESQAVLNTLTEHNFHDAFKKWQKLWEPCVRAEGHYFEDDGGQ
jgi:hypothetical protein